MPDNTETQAELAAFEEWLKETAAREGTSSGEVLNQLMSTYWILNELNTVLEDTPYDDLAALEADAPTETTPEETGGDHDAIVEVIQSIAEMNASQEQSEPTSGGSIDPGLIQLIEALDGSKTTTESSGSFDGISQYRIEKLRDDVADLSRALDAIEDDTEELDEQFEVALSQQQRQLSRLKQDIELLEEAFEGAVDPEELSALADQIDERTAAVDSRIDAIDDRFEDAYASIKRILEHLLTSTDVNAERLEILVDIIESEFEELAIAHEEYERLVRLKNEANRRDIRTPHCDSCESEIDIALLGSPYCPDCDREITGFEKHSKFMGDKLTATTRGRRDEAEIEPDVLRRIRRQLNRVDQSSRELPGELDLDEPDED